MVQRVGTDLADAGDIMWTPSPNIAIPNATDCYVYVDQTFVGLFEGSFGDEFVDRAVGHPMRDGLYWNTGEANWEETELHGDEGFIAD